VIREGTFDDIPTAAAVRQRAWTDAIITAEGMRHHIENVPARAELMMLAFEHAGELAGWATASRAWWASDPGKGVAAIAVDQKHRGRGIASELMDELALHLGRLGVTTVRGESMDEPAARALAEARGFTETGSSSASAVDPRTVCRVPARLFCARRQAYRGSGIATALKSQPRAGS
jgi:GNAT superfamily N-acetyltransferase